MYYYEWDDEMQWFAIRNASGSIKDYAYVEFQAIILVQLYNGAK